MLILYVIAISLLSVINATEPPCCSWRLNVYLLSVLLKWKMKIFLQPNLSPLVWRLTISCKFWFKNFWLLILSMPYNWSTQKYQISISDFLTYIEIRYVEHRPKPFKCHVVPLVVILIYFYSMTPTADILISGFVHQCAARIVSKYKGR